MIQETNDMLTTGLRKLHIYAGERLDGEVGAVLAEYDRRAAAVDEMTRLWVDAENRGDDLAAQCDAVLALHRRDIDDGCTTCRVPLPFKPPRWPCPTARALGVES